MENEPPHLFVICWFCPF